MLLLVSVASVCRRLILVFVGQIGIVDAVFNVFDALGFVYIERGCLIGVAGAFAAAFDAGGGVRHGLDVAIAAVIDGCRPGLAVDAGNVVGCA